MGEGHLLASVTTSGVVTTKATVLLVAAALEPARSAATGIAPTPTRLKTLDLPPAGDPDANTVTRALMQTSCRD